MQNLPCVLFAGGKSSRMGEDKSLLPFGGFDTLVEYHLFKLQKIFPKIYISTKSKGKFSFEAEFIEDIDSNIYAPTIALISMFQKTSHNSLFVLSVDTPFVDESIISTLIQNHSEDLDATVATTQDLTHPLCGVYNRSIAPYIEKMVAQNNHKLNTLLKQCNTNYVDFEPSKKFLNLNHPHQYQEALLLVTGDLL